MVNTMEKKPYITERVYVETPVDTDGDGKKDLIAVYLRLPTRRSGRAERIPAIYVANPYMLTCNEDWYVPYTMSDCAVTGCSRRRTSRRRISASITRRMRSEYTSAGPFAERPTMGCAEHAPIDAEPEFECVCDSI